MSVIKQPGPFNVSISVYSEKSFSYQASASSRVKKISAAKNIAPANEVSKYIVAVLSVESGFYYYYCKSVIWSM
jgi:hypothetical protein